MATDGKFAGEGSGEAEGAQDRAYGGAEAAIADLFDMYQRGLSATCSIDYDTDGDVVLEFACHYQLIHDGQDWLIASIVNE